MYIDDKRMLPEFGPLFWSRKKSTKKWHYCKYCYKDVPTFFLTEGIYHHMEPLQIMRVCWECGSGIGIIYHNSKLNEKVPSIVKQIKGGKK